MKRLKQPWFMILVLVVSIYTYQFYKNPKLIKMSTNQAQATSQTDEKSSESTEKERISVKLTQSFKATGVQAFELATYLNMKVKFSKSDGNQVIVSLLGEGADYRNDGKKLTDWFNIKTANKTLKIKSPNKNDYKGFASMKELAKTFNRSSASDLTMIIEFPESHVFTKVKIEGVSNDVYASELRFKSFKMASVSGDLQLTQCQGTDVKVETVSGDTTMDLAGLKKAEFASVSGDATLKVKDGNPELKFESVSGDLVVTIPGDSDVDVNFESMTGELVNDFGVSKKATNQLKFSSLSGSATINKIK